MNLETIKAHFSIIRDERQSAKVDYPLFDILFGSIRDSAAILGINYFIQCAKKLKQPSLILLNSRDSALIAKFECVDTFEF